MTPAILKMKPLLLTPRDLLFFRDSRPMSGSLAGHGAEWPLPHIIHQAFHAAFHRAFHAAFHRAGLDSHLHRSGVSGRYTDERNQRFGSLKTAGPFPVSPQGEWFAPVPADMEGVRLICVPPSSLPAPLQYAAASIVPPSKEPQPGWQSLTTPTERRHSADIFTSEARIGIGIDAATQTQDGESIYTAHYLRLQKGWRLGILAEATDKKHGDLLETFLDRETHLILGGQQGACRIEKAPTSPFAAMDCPTVTSTWIKWTLLSPTVFMNGWRPHWVDPESGAVALPIQTPRQDRESRAAWRDRVHAAPVIQAHLRAAFVPKPVVFSGWNLRAGCAKPTQLAVPAGAVYYFEAANLENAKALAQALHLRPRSSQFGEKGFGIGRCDIFPVENPI